MTIQDWVVGLIRSLTPHYTLPNISGGHETDHVIRMAKMGPKIWEILDFDLWEYEAAVWLHNVDRSKSLVGDVQAAGGFEAYCRLLLLQGSPFSPEARDRIATAVREHTFKEEASNDSPLTLALKIADKLDRFGSLGALSIAAHRGGKLPLYNAQRPFGFDTIEEDGLGSLYGDFMRVLSWYRMMHSDAARALVDLTNFRFFISFIRQLGAEIALATGQPNSVESDISKALGRHYSDFC